MAWGRVRSKAQALLCCSPVTKSCLTLLRPYGAQSASSSVYGISQTRILEWVAIPFSRGSSQPRDWTGSPALQAGSLPLSHPGSPKHFLLAYKRIIIQLLVRCAGSGPVSASENSPVLTMTLNTSHYYTSKKTFNYRRTQKMKNYPKVCLR